MSTRGKVCPANVHQHVSNRAGFSSAHEVTDPRSILGPQTAIPAPVYANLVPSVQPGFLACRQGRECPVTPLAPASVLHGLQVQPDRSVGCVVFPPPIARNRTLDKCACLDPCWASLSLSYCSHVLASLQHSCNLPPSVACPSLSHFVRPLSPCSTGASRKNVYPKATTRFPCVWVPCSRDTCALPP